MDSKTGVFKVPFSGRYVFHFNGLKVGVSRQLHVTLRKNGKTDITSSYAGNYVTEDNKLLVPIILNCVVNLNKGDEVALYLIEGTLSGSTINNATTIKSTNSFVGFLIEQEISF